MSKIDLCTQKHFKPLECDPDNCLTCNDYNVDINVLLAEAIKIAAGAHAGQVDKNGDAYILHPIRVMMAGQTDEERICGVLHDVVEDSNITLDDLRAAGFSEDLIIAIDCLTKRQVETYDEFIDRILTNKMASNVKLIDINDNMNKNRLEKLPTKEIERLCRKYQNALSKILFMACIDNYENPTEEQNE